MRTVNLLTLDLASGIIPFCCLTNETAVNVVNPWVLLVQNDKWLTIDELADYLEMGRTKLYRLAQAGEIPCFESWHSVAL
jgi:exo-beta-1,3-glucanase (GH17 family)